MKIKCQILSLATLATYDVKCVFKCKGNCLTFLVKKHILVSALPQNESENIGISNIGKNPI